MNNLIINLLCVGMAFIIYLNAFLIGGIKMVVLLFILAHIITYAMKKLAEEVSRFCERYDD